MPNFTKLFQDEVRRLARKETKDSYAELKRENIELRRTLSAVKKRLDRLEREKKKLGKEIAQVLPEVQEEPEHTSPAERARFSSTTIRNLRQRLRLTQAELAQLVGVTGQSVYQWERKDGQLQLRKATREALYELRDLGVREAHRRLEEE